MIKDCKILLKFKKLKDFNVSDYYFNPCLFSILFNKSIGINNFMLMEMDRYENSDDEDHVYSLVSGFTPINDQEEFLDRNFEKLSDLMNSINMFNCQVRMNRIDKHELIDVNKMIKYDHFKLIMNKDEYK